MAGSVSMITLSAGENFVGCASRRALIEDHSRRCYALRSPTERVVLDGYGDTLDDFDAVVDGFAVLVFCSDVDCLVRVHRLDDGALVMDEALPFEVWGAAASRDELVLSGREGIALMNKRSYRVRQVVTSDERSWIDLMGGTVCGRWLIAENRQAGIECRDLDKLHLQWERGTPMDGAYAGSSPYALDDRSYVAAVGNDRARWIEVVDAETGSPLWSLTTDGALVGTLDRKVLVRDNEALNAYCIDSDRVEWSVAVPRGSAVVPVAKGVWIQRGNEVIAIDPTGRESDAIAIGDAMALVGASDDAVFVQRSP